MNKKIAVKIASSKYLFRKNSKILSVSNITEPLSRVVLYYFLVLHIYNINICLIILLNISLLIYLKNNTIIIIIMIILHKLFLKLKNIF